ncbi:MAG TPA: glycosyltransferase family 2 protein [Pirellulales bacterium]|nr:glycosyltransferase family 2 protein [Pirellulales bacterium]
MADSTVVIDAPAGPPSPARLDCSVSLSVVMPCLNEERTVGRCVGKALAAIERLGITGEVVVSDNGSSDGSVAAAKKAGARVVHCSERGYGNAIRRGVEDARGQWIIMGDADDSYDFERIDPFVEQLRRGADVVMGNRYRGGIRPGAMPWKNRYLGNPVLTFVLNLLFHTGIGDSQCGLRAFSRQAFDAMGLECAGMEFASEMLVKAVKRQLVVAEVPTTLDPDGRGRPPHLAPWSDACRILRLLLREWRPGKKPPQEPSRHGVFAKRVV